MTLLTRFLAYAKAEVWRPDEPRIYVRKQRPGFGWTINFAALRDRLRSR